MLSEQKEIYYINGENPKELINSPLLEGILSNGYDIILMNEPIDEYVISSLKSFEGKQLKSVTNDIIPINNINKPKINKSILDMTALCTYVLKILKDKVTNVIESKRLINYPCCLTNNKAWSWSPQMEKVMKYQTLGNNTNLLKPSRVLELNPHHKIIKYLYDLILFYFILYYLVFFINFYNNPTEYSLNN